MHTVLVLADFSTRPWLKGVHAHLSDTGSVDSRAGRLQGPYGLCTGVPKPVKCKYGSRMGPYDARMGPYGAPTCTF